MQKVFAVWRTGLPRPVLVLQGGTALNYFGTGLILPFEIIYLHAVRGFSTATAGLVLATVMGTAAAVTLPSGALLDRLSAKRILIAGTVVNAVGYGAWRSSTALGRASSARPSAVPASDSWEPPARS
jgi:MFS family permease